MKFFSHPEGYVDTENGNKYVYQYKDHLGNVRLSYLNIGTTGTPNLEIQEESNYYPFGLKQKGYNSGIGSYANIALKRKFNGIELEQGLGVNLYEMDLRKYDPALARWIGIDPVTHHSMSTYNAFDNNPVYWADPSGADAWTHLGGGVYKNNRTSEETTDWQRAVGETEARSSEKKSNTDPPSKKRIGELIGATIRGWWKTIYGGGGEEVETVAEAGNVSEARKMDKQRKETVALKTRQLEEYWEAISIIPGSSGAKAFVEADQGNYGKAALSLAMFYMDVIPGEGFVSKGVTQYSDDLVRAAQRLYPNKAGKIELHHIIPKYLGGAQNGPLVPLDASYHQVITNEFRALWPYGKGIPSSTELQNIMRQVYSKYPLPFGY